MDDPSSLPLTDPTSKAKPNAYAQLMTSPRHSFWLRQWLVCVPVLALVAAGAIPQVKPLLSNAVNGAGSIHPIAASWVGAINPTLLLPFAAMIFILGWCVAHGVYTRRLRRRLSQHEDLLCLRCHYLLHELSEWGRCSECGQAYKLEHTRVVWHRWRDQDRD